MGNHHSYHDGRKKEKIDATKEHVVDAATAQPQQLTESASGTDLQEKPSHLLPVEKLAKILAKRCQEEEGINGVTQTIFAKYLFPRYPLLAEKLFHYFHQQAHVKTTYLSTSAFKQQCERFLGILADDAVLDLTVRIFAHDEMTPDEMTSLIMCAYHVAMDHYSEGPQMCLGISKTLKTIVNSCFHAKTALSWHYVATWMKANCPRLLLPLHRYAIHSLATSWRVLEVEGPLPAAGLELATPVLEQPCLFAQGKNNNSHHLLNMSMSWLLAGALPLSYSRPQRAHSPNSSAVGISSQAFLEKLLCVVPSHWINLYDSDTMGLGTNRFLHHVMAYKGPTLCLLKVDDGSLFCIACPNEWKESHLYWGGEDACLFQLLPTFLLLEKGSKSLYLNTTIRGYPQGLRVGKDPRTPFISVNAGFDKLDYRKIPYTLERIEVWGCGDPTARDVQLDVKKWEVKEAERQRAVKLSAAEWLDHPDRYLLELGGRQQYHQNPGQ